MPTSKIGDEGAKAIAEALRVKQWDSLTLDLSANRDIGDAGKEALREAVKGRRAGGGPINVNV